MKKLNTLGLFLAGVVFLLAPVAHGQWHVYHLSYHAQVQEGDQTLFQDLVTTLRDEGLISAERETSARANAQQQYEAWKQGFIVQGEAKVRSTGQELSHTYPVASTVPMVKSRFDWLDGGLTLESGRVKIHSRPSTGPANSPVGWLFLGGELNANYVEAERDTELRTIRFERPFPAEDKALWPEGRSIVIVRYSDDEMTVWESADYVLDYGPSEFGHQVRVVRKYEATGTFGMPGYEVTVECLDGNGQPWRVYKFEFLRTEASGFTPASIPSGTQVLDHRVPNGNEVLTYEWDGTFADVSQHAGGGFPVAGWYVLSALGFAALGVYFWRKR